MTDRTEKRWLIAVIALAVAVRLGAALYLGAEVRMDPAIADQVSYHALALRVLEGHGFSFGEGWWPATSANEPTAHWSYLYTLLLAGVYGLSDADPLTARLLQAALIGILQPLLTWRIGRRLFGSAVGLTAAGVTAVYAYFVYYSAALLTESLFIVCVLWTLDLAMRMASADSRSASWFRDWALLGLSLGIAGLLRQTMLLFAPMLILWVLYRQAKQITPGLLTWDRLITRAGLAAGVIGVLVLPWTYRNFRAFDSFVLLNTNAGFAFFWGNHPIHKKGFIPILPGDGPNYGELIPDDLRSLNEADLDRALMARGIEFVREDPVRYGILSASRAAELFKFWPTAESSALSNFARVFSFGLTLPFMLVGISLFIRNSSGGPIALQEGAALLLFGGFFMVLHLASWALVRYRVPVDAALVPFAALGIVAFQRWLVASLSGILPTGPSVAGAARARLSE